jgi:hypothetical protein
MGGERAADFLGVWMEWFSLLALGVALAFMSNEAGTCGRRPARFSHQVLSRGA